MITTAHFPIRPEEYHNQPILPTINSLLPVYDFPLIDAVRTGILKNVMEVLEKGNIDLNDFDLPLEIAIQKGELDIIQALITAGVNVNQTYKDGTHPLYQAIECGRLYVVNALIEAGADVNQVNENGMSPLMIAAQKGILDIIQA